MPAPGGRPPLRVEGAQHLSRSASPTTGKRYGLQRTCRVLGLARSTAYHLRAREAVPPEQRPAPSRRGPVGAAIYLTRPNMAPYLAHRADLEATAEDVFEVIRRGSVQVEVRKTYPSPGRRKRIATWKAAGPSARS